MGSKREHGAMEDGVQHINQPRRWSDGVRRQRKRRWIYLVAVLFDRARFSIYSNIRKTDPGFNKNKIVALSSHSYFMRCYAIPFHGVFAFFSPCAHGVSTVCTSPLSIWYLHIVCSERDFVAFSVHRMNYSTIYNMYNTRRVL